MDVWEEINGVEKIGDFVSIVADSAANQELAYITGAGVSMVQKMPSWDQYVDDLIDYWKSHVDTLNSNYSAVDSFVFDKIKSSNMSKQRKIDLVHQTLKDVTNNDWTLYQKSLLEFEKKYFSMMQPVLKHNEVINEMIKLPAKFLTTNYDGQVEKHLLDMYHRNVMTSVQDIGELGNFASLPDIVHIHGKPESEVANFVNSSLSYRLLYSSNNKNLKNFKRLLHKQITTTIIVGSSLEEDEVLGLLDKDANNYALMKVPNDNFLDPVESRFRKIQEEMFAENYGVQIIWYGSKFEHLAQFLHFLIEKVNQKNPEATVDTSFYLLNHWDYNAFKSYIYESYNTLQGRKNISDWLKYVFNSIVPGNKDDSVESGVHNFFKVAGELGRVEFLELFPEIWLILNKWEGKLNLEEKTLIRQYFAISLSLPFEFRLEIIDVTDSDLATDIYRNIAMHIKNVENLDYIHNSGILGWWITNGVVTGKTHARGSSDVLEISDIDFSSEAISDARAGENKFWVASNRSILEETEEFSLILSALRGERVFVDGVSIEKLDGEEEIFKWTLFQRAMVIVALEGVLSDQLLDILIDAIDFSNPAMGVEMNDFTLKFAEKLRANLNLDFEGKKFIDSFGPVEVGTVREFPLFTKSEMEKLDPMLLIERLEHSDSEIETGNVYEVRSQHATSSHLINWAKRGDMTESLSAFLQNLTRKAFDKIKEAVSEMSDPKSNIENSIKELSYQIYVKHYSGDTFDDNDVNFFSKQLESKEHLDEVLDLLKNVEVAKLENGASIERTSFLTIDYVVNSELGNYFWLLKSIGEEIDILEKLQEIKNINQSYYDFFVGFFGKWSDGISPNFQNFLGYTIKHLPFSGMISIFKNSITPEVIRDFFSSKDFGTTGRELAARSVAAILMGTFEVDEFIIPPIKLVMDNIKNMSLYSDFNFEHETEWISWVATNDEDGLYKFILRNLQSEKVIDTKLTMWLDVLNETSDANVSVFNAMVVRYQLMGKHADKLKVSKIIKRGILDGLIQFEGMDETDWKALLDYVDQDSRKEVMSRLEATNQITPVMKMAIQN